MKTLHAFWRYVENEKPATITREHLSETACLALVLAEAQVAARAWPDGIRSFSSTLRIWDVCSSDDGTNPMSRPEWYRPELVAAVRDLSLGLCPLLEAMNAAVPEGKPDPVALDSTFMTRARERSPYEYRLLAEESPFRREYLGSWHSAPEPVQPPDDEREHSFKDDRRYRTLWLQVTRVLEIRPTGIGGHLSLTCCDNMRGLDPRRIVLHGSRSDYDGRVLRYLHKEILAPMLANGAVLEYPNPNDAAVLSPHE